MARVPSSAIHSRSIRASAARFGRPGELLLGEQARLDALGQLDLLLGVEQRHLADLLQVVLDRVRRRARDRDLRGGQVIIIVTEDEDLLVLAAASGESLTDARAGRAGALGLGVRLGGRLARLRVLEVFRSVRYFRPVDVDGQIVGHLGDVADVVGEDSQDGERGLEAGIVGVEIAKVARIRVLQIRVGIQISLAEVHRDQAAVGVGAQPRTVFIRVPGTRTVWPRSRLNRLNLDGPRPLVRGPGALPAVTLRAAPGFALPGITPAHPYRLLDHRDKGCRTHRPAPALRCDEIRSSPVYQLYGPTCCPHQRGRLTCIHR